VTGQSSTDFGGISGRAIDVLWKPNYGSGSCTHTALEDNPYWYVDLGRHHVIESVWVHNRADCCRKYIKDSCPLVKWSSRYSNL